MELCINGEQLRKALAELEKAEQNGFTHSVAIFELATAGPMIDDCTMNYDSLIVKAHPTDGRSNWGRCFRPNMRFENGKLVTE